MKNNNSHLTTAVMCLAGLMFGAYLLWGYATFIDGVYFRKIIQFNDPLASDSKIPAKNITHVVTNKQYHAGDLVRARTDVEKYRRIEAIIQWNLKGNCFCSYPPRRGVLDRGHHNMVVNIERLPDNLTPGKYYFKGLIKYETNPLSDVYVSIQTDEFEVIK